MKINVKAIASGIEAIAKSNSHSHMTPVEIQPLLSFAAKQANTTANVEQATLELIKDLQSKQLITDWYKAEDICDFISGKNRSNKKIGKLLQDLEQRIKVHAPLNDVMAYSKGEITKAELNRAWDEKGTVNRSKIIKLCDDYLFPASTNPRTLEIEAELRAMGVDARLVNSTEEAEIILRAFRNMQSRGVKLANHVRVVDYNDCYLNNAMYSTTLNESWILLNKSEINPKKIVDIDVKAGIPREELEKISLVRTNELGLVYHESGHVANQLPPSESLTINEELFDKKFLDLRKNIEENVSLYAATNPDEFCAELFTGLMLSKKYSPELMDLYKHFNGKIPRQLNVMA